MRRLFAALTLFGSLSAIAPAAHAQQAPCQFVLGFQALHDMDTDDIGNCTDNQATTPAGDAQQHTTKGLMVWRKADNWTAFTNGYMTWINGPDGLVSRLNTEHFDWEATAPAAPAPAPAPQATPPPSPAAVPPPVDGPPMVGPDGKACPPGYPIKGQFPSHLYYLPGSPTYDKITDIAACFIDEATAKGGGYHPGQ